MEPAAYPEPQNIMFKEIFNSLQCQICLDTMNDPRTLPCGHNFCRECINNLVTAQRNRSSSLQCPNNCHPTTRIDLDNVKNLPRNFTLCSIIESMNQVKRCESHDNCVGFIDMTDGKLLCQHCLKKEQFRLSFAKVRLVAQADPSATPSTTVRIRIPRLSLPPGILTLSKAEEVVKSNLETLIVQSKSLVAKMKSLETQFRNDIKPIRRSAASLSKAIATISKTAEDTSIMLKAQCGQAAPEKLIPFLISAMQLQSSFASDLDAASKTLDAAKNLKSPSKIPRYRSNLVFSPRKLEVAGPL